MDERNIDLKFSNGILTIKGEKIGSEALGEGPHLGLQKDAPNRRPIERRGRIVTSDVLGGLHHQYCRI